MEYNALSNETNQEVMHSYVQNEIIIIKSIVYVEDEGKYYIALESHRLLLPEEITVFMRCFAFDLCTDEAHIDLKVEYEDAMGQLRADNEYGNGLIDTWGRYAPQLMPILQRCRVRNRGNEFTLFIPARYERVITQQSASEFRALLLKNYGLDAAIHVAVDSSLNDGMDGSTVVRQYARPPMLPVRERKKKPAEHIDPKDIIFGKEIRKPEIIPMSELNDKSGKVVVQGTVISREVFITKKNTAVITVFITDKTNTVAVKLFPESVEQQRTITLLEKAQSDGAALLVRGNYRYDSYTRDYCMFAMDINRRNVESRMDTAEDKRVELHLHTQMSAMDATCGVNEVIALAAKWGHKAIAITDHGVVHSFPMAHKAAKKNGIKMIFGCEGYLLPDCELVPAQGSFAAVSMNAIGSGIHARVFSLAARRFDADGAMLESFVTPVNPNVPPTKAIMELTGYDAEIIDGAPSIEEAVKLLSEFIGDERIVIHDPEQLKCLHMLVSGDCGLKAECVSTSMLMQYIRRDLKSEQRQMPELDAASGADWTAKLAVDLISQCRERNVNTLPLIDSSIENMAKQRTNHIILLAETQPGLKNLYKLISYSNLDHFYKTPRIPRSLLNIHREGIIVGSACEAGELFRALVNKESEERIERIASFYDYLEVQPIGNNAFLIREGVARDEEDLRDYNRRIVELGDKLGKPVVATGDVHFMEPEDSIFRAVLMTGMGYKDAAIQPPLYFKTTDEMLEEFSYLGVDKAREIVIDNPNAIADRCGKLRPFLDDKQTYSPELEGAADELQMLALTRAHELYGETLPEVVQKRLDKELGSIIGNGYSSLYMVAQKLVHKSNSDGYLVGSRGSVGSSFVAHMAGITEVNSLPAHYRCPNCKYSEFPDVGDSSRCGIDLPEKLCPVCGTPLARDGYDIPFETFLGFKGDKTPDIDLNFSGEYQPVAHKFTETMFGEGHAFRAGTLSEVKEKTAYGYVQNYCEQNNISVSEAEKIRLAAGCVGTRRTTGQHPGGIVIVPADLEIYDFCPVQHPAEKEEAESITTHFDFHALDDKLVKLDILGHDDPTTLRMLQDVTGLDPKSIPLSDPETMSLFRSEETLHISLAALECDVGSLGIPEFGTKFVRGMLMDTRPTTMEELVRISGLSHGTDVWLGNAQDLITSGTTTLMHAICTRDDIMNYLIACGEEPALSFKTMESVRKGRGLTPEMEDAMHKNNVPQWYIDSCKKIKYMFPRAHAAAYVMMGFRVAYYKVHYPLAFYSVYFTVRADKFDIEQCYGGADAVLERIQAIKNKDKTDNIDDEQMVILEIVYEMNLRGIELLPVDIYKSKATRFVIEDGRIRPPFNAIAGLGANAAQCIEQGASGGRYLSREDFAARTKANSSIMEKLERLGCLDELPSSNQVSMF